MIGKQTAELAGALAGLVMTGAALGLAAERYAVGRARLRPDPEAEQPFFALPADREHRVLADDGVALHVVEVGPAPGGEPALTVVLCHGYTHEMAVWHYQRQALPQAGGVRLVLWDQRAHGRSARGAPERSTIDQLGRDLSAVLDAVVPDGPVVLVGHSMGGMTIMALADQRPELFGPRVVGVGLLGTSAGKLAEVTLGLPARLQQASQRVLPWVSRGVRTRPAIFERGRRLGTDLAFVLTRRAGFGTGEVSPTVVEVVERMIAQTPVDVIAEFYDTFTSHDKLGALGVLHDVEVLVLVGSHDIVTPEDHSRAIAEALPHAELVVVDGAGHMVQLEAPAVVTSSLRDLLRRAAPDRPPAPREDAPVTAPP